MWSLGCILSELLTGMPLFPGEDEADQLSCIIEIIGMPSQKVLDASKRARNFVSSKGHPRYCTVTTLPDGTTVLQGGKDNKKNFEKIGRSLIVFRSFKTWQTSWTTC
jgi:dual specificity tyrosine-phosphorylation-regulated kinase 2/3/4